MKVCRWYSHTENKQRFELENWTDSKTKFKGITKKNMGIIYHRLIISLIRVFVGKVWLQIHDQSVSLFKPTCLNHNQNVKEWPDHESRTECNMAPWAMRGIILPDMHCNTSRWYFRFLLQEKPFFLKLASNKAEKLYSKRILLITKYYCKKFTWTHTKNKQTCIWTTCMVEVIYLVT